MKACCCSSLPFPGVVAPTRAINILKFSFSILVLQEFFQDFTQTTEQQPIRNLHFFTKLFAVMHAASNFEAYLSTMCEEIRRYSRVLARQMPNRFILFITCAANLSKDHQTLVLHEVSLQLQVFKHTDRSGIPGRQNQR